jgi:nucleotide-binding universal stress UspA family protein
MLPIQRILLPIDDSPGTQAAVDVAVVLANALGASLTLVHVDELPNAMVAIVPGASVDGDLATERKVAERRLTELISQLHATGFDKVTALHLAAPAVAPAIVDAARRYDLIVMGTHARTGVSRLVLGSVAEQVLRHATCPVVTVHLPPQT